MNELEDFTSVGVKFSQENSDAMIFAMGLAEVRDLPAREYI
ncbi:MAG: hypothetical protein ABFC97_05485 [Anaerolineaceae bacterium]